MLLAPNWPLQSVFQYFWMLLSYMDLLVSWVQKLFMNSNNTPWTQSLSKSIEWFKQSNDFVGLYHHYIHRPDTLQVLRKHKTTLSYPKPSNPANKTTPQSKDNGHTPPVKLNKPCPEEISNMCGQFSVGRKFKWVSMFVSTRGILPNRGSSDLESGKYVDSDA